MPVFSDPQPSEMEFLNEQRYYPRSDEKKPEWLKDGIRRLEEK
jgi:hypothetical protein